MNVLFLGYPDSPLVPFIRDIGDTVFVHSEKLQDSDLDQLKPDFLISYGYRFILRQPVLQRFLPERAINLHISYLPWNKGADPNFWSVFDGTPKGVSIHRLDAGLDTGELIAQKRLEFEDSQTLSSTYQTLHQEIQLLFKENWHCIKEGKAESVPQGIGGSMHRMRDKERLWPLLPNGWESTLSEVRLLSERLGKG